LRAFADVPTSDVESDFALVFMCPFLSFSRSQTHRSMVLPLLGILKRQTLTFCTASGHTIALDFSPVTNGLPSILSPSFLFSVNWWNPNLLRPIEPPCSCPISICLLILERDFALGPPRIPSTRDAPIVDVSYFLPPCLPPFPSPCDSSLGFFLFPFFHVIAGYLFSLVVFLIPVFSVSALFLIVTQTFVPGLTFSCSSDAFFFFYYTSLQPPFAPGH